jgi:hypothetical protein
MAAGGPLNITSPKEVSAMLFERLNLPPPPSDHVTKGIYYAVQLSTTTVVLLIDPARDPARRQQPGQPAHQEQVRAPQAPGRRVLPGESKLAQPSAASEPLLAS